MKWVANSQFLAHIQTPSISTFSLGPFTVHIYALCVLLGAVVALFGAFLRAKRFHMVNVLMPDAENILDSFFVILPVGIIGARLYYCFTVPSLFKDNPLSIFYIWEGGLGIIGGILAGVLAAYLFFRSRNISLKWFVWCAAPMVPLAQCIGRLGNWFNAELYGSPTDLPWGLDISRGAYTAHTFYHPTFLYEMILDLVICIILLKIFKLPTESAEISLNFLPFSFYLILYSTGRFFIELLRTDYSDYLLGMRVNIWAILALLLLGCGITALDMRTRRKKNL
ncbi:MAG: prolipoprotein diacylglyceryl transferase [Candidatus Ancillula sp.]|jgi:prolipoprotein diacylglyceryl transferase|nr:prolipoprotein diacylglyceryl transferase [Candidatus Ancillula sp.]